MRDVIEQREAGLWQRVGKCLPDQMGDDLAIREGAIDARPHRAEILLSHFRVIFVLAARDPVVNVVRAALSAILGTRPICAPAPRAAVNLNNVPFVKVNTAAASVAKQSPVALRILPAECPSHPVAVWRDPDIRFASP
jgi:hypothetical protein